MDFHSCGQSCVISKPKGMATNGPCRCLEGIPQNTAKHIRHALLTYRQKITEAESVIGELMKALLVMRETHTATLDANSLQGDEFDEQADQQAANALTRARAREYQGKKE